MMAMKSLLCAFVRKYKIFTPYKRIEDIELECKLMLRPKDGYKISLELRQ